MKTAISTILGGFLCLAAAAAPEFDTAAAVTASAPGAAFLQGEQLAFRWTQPERSPGKWQLRDWRNRLIRQGDWPEDGRKKLLLAPLPNGYYKLELSGGAGSRGFAVVPDPAGRENNPEQFFAMDSAQSWLARPDAGNPRQPDKPFEVVSETARRAGLRMVRERLN